MYNNILNNLINGFKNGGVTEPPIDLSNIDTTKTAASESTGVAMPHDSFGDNMDEFLRYNTLDSDYVIPDRLKPREKYDDSHWADTISPLMKMKNNMNSAATNILTLASELRLPTDEEKKARAQYQRNPHTGSWEEREGQTAKNINFALNTIPNAAINLFGFSRKAASQAVVSAAKMADTALAGIQGDVDTFEKGIETILFKKSKSELLKNLVKKPVLNKAQKVIKKGLAFDKNPTTKAYKNRAKAVHKLSKGEDQDVTLESEAAANLRGAEEFSKLNEREKAGRLKKWERMHAISQRVKKRESLASFKEGGEVEGVEEQQELPLRTSSTTPVSQEYWDFINTREGYTPDKLKEIEDHEELYQAKQNFYKDAYNTPLSKDEQALYDIWYPKAVRDKIINPMDHGVYDIPGFWQSGQWKSKDGRGHGTDTFKKPNHITFSNESKWSSQQGGSPFEGGSWDETGGFKPGKDNFYDNGQIEYEFDRERKYWEEKGKKNMVPEHLMYGIPESITEMEEMPQDNTNVNLDLIPEESFNIE
jgi:hypothetical protein